MCVGRCNVTDEDRLLVKEIRATLKVMGTVVSEFLEDNPRYTRLNPVQVWCEINEERANRLLTDWDKREKETTPDEDRDDDNAEDFIAGVV